MIEPTPLVRVRCDGLMTKYTDFGEKTVPCDEITYIPAHGTLQDDETALSRQDWFSKFGNHYCSQECYEQECEERQKEYERDRKLSTNY